MIVILRNYPNITFNSNARWLTGKKANKAHRRMQGGWEARQENQGNEENDPPINAKMK